MLWLVTASYGGDTVDFTLTTEKDDLKDALVEARQEAIRVFDYGGAGAGDPPTVHVKKHPNII